MSPDGTLHLPLGDDHERYRFVRERTDVLGLQCYRTHTDDEVLAVGPVLDPQGDAMFLDPCGRGR